MTLIKQILVASIQ